MKWLLGVCLVLALVSVAQAVNCVPMCCDLGCKTICIVCR